MSVSTRPSPPSRAFPESTVRDRPPPRETQAPPAQREEGILPVEKVEPQKASPSPRPLRKAASRHSPPGPRPPTAAPHGTAQPRRPGSNQQVRKRDSPSPAVAHLLSLHLRSGSGPGARFPCSLACGSPSTATAGFQPRRRRRRQRGSETQE